MWIKLCIALNIRGDLKGYDNVQGEPSVISSLLAGGIEEKNNCNFKF